MSNIPSKSAFANRTSGSLQVHMLGVVDFDSAQFLQNRLHYEIAGRQDRFGGLLICEHPPLITIGRDGSASHVNLLPEEAVSKQIKSRWVNRGGPAVVNSPGQLAVYPILPLKRLGIGMADFRRRLEQSVIDVCTDCRIKAWRDEDEPGVWCRTGRIASIGAAIKRGVSFQGMFVNVAPDPVLSELVDYPGHDRRVSSLAAQPGQRATMHSIRSGLIHRIAGQFGYDDYNLYTGHPLLKRMPATAKAIAQSH